MCPVGKSTHTHTHTLMMTMNSIKKGLKSNMIFVDAFIIDLLMQHKLRCVDQI
jgi:hypothetical protein